MNLQDQFLTEYKNFETILRDLNLDYKDIESEVDSETSEKMRLCRNLRNYLSHNSDKSFVSISKNMIDFLTDLEFKYLSLEDTVIKHSDKFNSSNYCLIRDNCSSVLEKMIKKKVNNFLVVNKEEFKVVSIYQLIQMLLISKTKKVKDISDAALS